MAVAKRQGREKPTKIEQRKVQGPDEDLRWDKQHSWLAPFTQGRPRGRKHIKRGAQGPGLSLFASLGRHALTPRGCIFLLFST